MTSENSPLKGLLCTALAVGSALLPLAASGEDSFADIYDITLSGGADFATGKYGTDTSTDIWYIPFTAKLEAERHAFKITVPYLSITDSGSVVGGGDQVIVVGDGGDGEKTTEEGIGDIIGVMSFYVFPGTEKLPLVDLNYKIKVPTADEDRGLGTGKFDHSFEVDFTKVYDKITVFSTVGYKVFGDPDDYDLDNVFYGSIGAQYSLDEISRLGLIYDIRDRTTDSGHGISELTGYYGRTLSEHWRLMVYGVAGLSDGSPDWGAGITLSRKGGLASLFE